MPGRNFFLSPKASKARLREAENARRNRWDIINSQSQGQVSRRDLIKMGLFTGAGLLLPISGLSPFARSAFADSNIPTGLPPSPLFGVQAFSQPMPRFDLFPRIPVASLSPAPTAEANTTQQPVAAALGGGTGPIEGRPPGPISHDLDARAQRPSRRGERRLHRRVLLPGPVLRLPLADRARRALQR
jgi:hypothetical protein